MLRSRKSAAALADDARERGSDIAEKAAELAREAQKAATPVIRSAMANAAGRAREAQKVATPVVRSAAATAAEALSDAAEQAAEVLADTAGRLAPVPPRRRRVRRILMVTGVVGAGAGVMMSPLGARLRALVGLGGSDSEIAPVAPGILLPSNSPVASEGQADEVPAAQEPGANGDHVLSGGRTRGSDKEK